jgi:hypothetical protein
MPLNPVRRRRHHRSSKANPLLARSLNHAQIWTDAIRSGLAQELERVQDCDEADGIIELILSKLKPAIRERDQAQERLDTAEYQAEIARGEYE